MKEISFKVIKDEHHGEKYFDSNEEGRYKSGGLEAQSNKVNAMRTESKSTLYHPFSKSFLFDIGM